MARLSFFHRLGAGAATIGQPAPQEMNPALHRQDLTMKAEVLGVFRGTLPCLFCGQPVKMNQRDLAIVLRVRDAFHGKAHGSPAAKRHHHFLAIMSY